MTKPMQDDEHEIASVIADFLAAGDERIASKHGLVTLHGVHTIPWTSKCNRVIARLESADGRPVDDDEYELTITARRRAR